MPGVNPGPAIQQTVNTQSPYSGQFTLQTIAMNLTPVAVGAATVAEQSFGLNGVSQATPASGIKAGDVIVGVSPPGITAGVGPIAGRSDPVTDDKVYISFVNPTAGGLSPLAGLYLITVARFNQSNKPPGTTTFGFVPTTIS